jgi:hypothetical protein
VSQPAARSSRPASPPLATLHQAVKDPKILPKSYHNVSSMSRFFIDATADKFRGTITYDAAKEKGTTKLYEE